LFHRGERKTPKRDGKKKGQRRKKKGEDKEGESKAEAKEEPIDPDWGPMEKGPSALVKP